MRQHDPFWEVTFRLRRRLYSSCRLRLAVCPSPVPDSGDKATAVPNQAVTATFSLTGVRRATATINIVNPSSSSASCTTEKGEWREAARCGSGFSRFMSMIYPGGDQNTPSRALINVAFGGPEREV